MAKHPTSSRVHRGDDSPDDAFVAAVKRTVAWVRTHDRQLTIAGVLVAVLIAAGVYWVSSQRRVESQAAARFSQVQQSLASGNTQVAIRDIEAYLETFGDADAARPARILLADLYLQEDRPAEAIQALARLPRDLDDPFGTAAARLLAAAHEEMGELDEAVSLYRRLAANARFPYQRREALADAARVRLQSGDPAAAAELYEDVVETFEEQEPGRGYYVMWLAEAHAMAAEGEGAAPTIADTTAAARLDSAPAGS